MFDAAMSNRPLETPIDIQHTPCNGGFEAHELSRVSNSAKLASKVLDRAWKQSQLPSHRNRLDGRGHRERDPKTALVVGYSLAQLDEAFLHTDSAKGTRGPYTLSTLRGNALTAPLAIRFGIGGGTHIVSAASATGGQAIVTAGQLIKTGQVDRVAIVCLDHFSHPETERLMRVVGAVTDDPQSLPLSKKRSGMRPMPAAAAMILEREDVGKLRGMSPKVSWINGVIRSDCHHLVAPEPTSTALLEATQATLAQAGYPSNSIHWLSLHATGTQLWDASEANAVRQMFAKKPPHLSAFKRTFGHTLAAAGLFEAIMLVEAMTRGIVSDPLEKLDSSLGLDTFVPTTAAGNALMWSAGMGGDIAVNLFGRQHG